MKAPWGWLTERMLCFSSYGDVPSECKGSTEAEPSFALWPVLDTLMVIVKFYCLNPAASLSQSGTVQAGHEDSWEAPPGVKVSVRT